ncbi:MAG: YceI family protein [Rhodocyclaceae bacterium]|nr:MAG: YceI family protein [Rhodocyclaceae bacterium]
MCNHSKIARQISAILMIVAFPCLAADQFRIDPDHSFAAFEYDHWGLSYQRGRFDKTSGVIELDVEAKSGLIEITIETASISTGVGVFDKILRSGDFFDTDNYPKTNFKSSRLIFDADRLTRVEGDLTIKGIKRPATLEISRFNCRFMVL